jgi:hypothetical protein
LDGKYVLAYATPVQYPIDPLTGIDIPDEVVVNKIIDETTTEIVEPKLPTTYIQWNSSKYTYIE